MSQHLAYNLTKKEADKLSKYEDLKFECEQMQKLSPVVIGASGAIKKNTNKYINEIPGNVNLDQLQKITLLGTAHILRKFFSN